MKVTNSSFSHFVECRIQKLMQTNLRDKNYFLLNGPDLSPIPFTAMSTDKERTGPIAVGWGQASYDDPYSKQPQWHKTQWIYMKLTVIHWYTILDVVLILVFLYLEEYLAINTIRFRPI